MLRNNKHIAIILSDSLQCMGLQCMLTEYFPPVEIDVYADFSDMKDRQTDSYDYYFTNAETLVLNADFFLPRKNKTLIIIDSVQNINKLPSINYISSKSALEVVIEQIEHVFAADNSNMFLNVDSNKGLSAREIDVLQLIVKGITNKEIADKLKISLNTVLTHRKNITSKLGIKTVSGLTFYAIMNGLISGDEIEL